MITVGKPSSSRVFFCAHTF